MVLYLAQHGKALPEEIDPERSLTEEGTAEVERVADRARQAGIRVSRIIHSGKKRARQTAEIFAARLTPGTAPEVSDGLGPKDDVAPLARTLGGEDGLMIVGHLPFLERLVSLLVARDRSARVLRFANGGIVCLERSEDEGGEESWAAKWALTPEIA